MGINLRKCYTCDHCKKEAMDGEHIHWISIKIEGMCSIGLYEKSGLKAISDLLSVDFCSQQCAIKYIISKIGGKSA